jgi:hypothetical protein
MKGVDNKRRRQSIAMPVLRMKSLVAMAGYNACSWHGFNLAWKGELSVEA